MTAQRSHPLKGGVKQNRAFLYLMGKVFLETSILRRQRRKPKTHCLNIFVIGHHFSDQFILLRILGCFLETCCSFQTLKENEHYGCFSRAAWVQRGPNLFFPPASLNLCEKEVKNNQHPVSKASCLRELSILWRRYFEPKQLIVPISS